MKDAYYFPHDSNAKDDPKIVLLIEQLGLEGYGIYWVLIEILRDQPNYRYPLTLVPSIARRYVTTKEKIETVVINYGLFIIENDEFFLSPSLCRRMEVIDERRKRLSMAGKRGRAIQLQTPMGHPQAMSGPPPGSKGKKKKGKERKEKKEKKGTIVEQNITRPHIPYKKIVSFLNEKANRDFKHTTTATRIKIKARFNEGFTEEDFQTVIENRVERWAGESTMVQYLRPETLFGPKFESYLQAAAEDSKTIEQRGIHGQWDTTCQKTSQH
ncbi:conserved phage C-terminal domain-containing protein [Desulfopila inferna]|uniref:conserved phage C-terminal domain-containing protein n=1 Tax=Desulfopila inferna TaxID=468528 RepID=UPI001965C1FC|nr:conserved phage C-terminal domain-containing protein [Desulfopila inferna]MBM9604106.1 conserved phage C-terminal domain-containing protein [Desulfopila inferna]